MSSLNEMQARLDALKKTSLKLNQDEELEAEVARAIEREEARLDEERGERLRAEADIACARVRAQLAEEGKNIPVEAFWNLSAFKLCGVGWLVLGPEDKGYAAEALKNEGKAKDNGSLKFWESNPDICRVSVCRATLAAPVPKDKLSRALMDAPHFVVSCHRKVEQLSGSQLKEVAGKSAG